ncbi:MAG: helix-turn-helix transcriptional regulator [Deltaproteobacteria bacterium]
MMIEKLYLKAPWNKRLEILRIALDLSQYEAAQMCGTNQRTYWSWEKGINKPIKNSRKAISCAFAVDEEEIFFR